MIRSRNVRLFKHQVPVGAAVGSAPATFDDVPVDSLSVTPNAMFSVPGEYVVRIRADDHHPDDGGPGDQWPGANGYVRGPRERMSLRAPADPFDPLRRT